MQANKFAKFIFEGKTLRVRTDEKGALWVVLADLCNVAHTERDRAGRLTDCEKAMLFVRTVSGNQMMLCVSESGMNWLLSTSTSPQSKLIYEWIPANLFEWVDYGLGSPELTCSAPSGYRDDDELHQRKGNNWKSRHVFQ